MGEDIAYVRCGRCGFVFTTHFDALTDAEIGIRIYNSDYHLADPDFAVARPRSSAEVLQAMLGPDRKHLRVLDYGGGNGLLTRIMRERGYLFDSYDPYFGDRTAEPEEKSYDLITAFEVFEHSRDPIGTSRDALRFAKPSGAFLASTLTLPNKADIDWWYIAPRNGHFSIFTSASLDTCARALGRRVLSLSEGFHLFYAEPPSELVRDWAAREARSARYAASIRGTGQLFRTGDALWRAGARRNAFSFRDLGRALALDFGLMRPEKP
ncbi:class I SAM-dependent methyltransferase [Sabulicella rubraurantiaca]|uniref:class I SAM-dependent methyltransferase n=1 Tax=Sabulicella rubraurantiaca TaxID=2811429 RepID=UPI001A9707B2|nr:class I SAM-dependent methyltransferase [Sabulicella rubraurantiaca]